MIAIVPRPGLLSGLIVATSVVGGIAFGVAAVSAALAFQAARARMSR